ncbi:hypothetical protein DE146DRAFT_748074 [Phaeosphaeria sp. MPI-PUGE-AT-0046c]|nr:hypothetical protein DE146DRAFT_748074 [Phaeosphaeria sp. MPI-PUGE-AT-0046c]
MSGPQKSRRQRAILSCNECRRRKLKCDRLSPCDRCIKGDMAESCAYGSDAHTIDFDEVQDRPEKKQCLDHRAARSTPSEAYQDPSREQTPLKRKDVYRRTEAVDRLEHLEREIALLQRHAPRNGQPTIDGVEFLTKSPDLRATSRHAAGVGMMKGRGYGTLFYGASSAMSVVGHFPDLRTFMKVAFSESTARRLSQDIKALQDKAKLARPQNRVLKIHSLRSLLPERETVDALLKVYFDSFETSLRIIHVHSFQVAYSTYWDTETAEDTEMDAVIIAILACTVCASTHQTPRYNHDGSTFHSKGVLWIRACEAWLKRQSHKRRSLATLQVRCLRLLALATTSTKVKEYYQEVQFHVALMRSSGMHRDPSIFGTRCSIVEGEMRRRLWATTMELELQASLDRGTSSILSSLDYDCAPPRNINDCELTSDVLELPRSRGITTYTDTSYLHVAAKSIQLRIKVCSSVNTLGKTPNFPDGFEVEDSLRQQIGSIPPWTDARSLQASTLLELQLQQYIIVLHAPRTLQLEPWSKSESRYAMITALEAAVTTIDLHSALIKAANFSLVLTRNDYLRAMLLICHIAYYSQKHGDAIMARMAKEIFDNSQTKSLRLQEERAMRPGRGSEFFWYISAAISLVQMQFTISKANSIKEQAAERVARLLYKVLSLHDDPTEETLANEILLADDAQRTTTDGAPALNALATSTLGDEALQLDAFDIGDTPEFMIDDLWFLNVPILDMPLDLPAGT